MSAHEQTLLERIHCRLRWLKVQMKRTKNPAEVCMISSRIDKALYGIDPSNFPDQKPRLNVALHAVSLFGF
jgi:hypothetical protein